MKKITFGLIILAISIIFLGCSSSTKEVSGVNKLKGIEYEIVENVPRNIENSIEDIKENQGYKVIESKENGKYIYIGLGEKNTGGYDIVIEKVEKDDNITKITIMEYKPKTDDMVTQAITYPYKIIKIEDIEDVKDIKVVTIKGKEFKIIE
ncbi:protease complex subunit PrcB family protein [Clostridium sp. D2Q-14]|uniref:protease complex subunit PrcB family protein n=1 Tax=Anaeromonas gelatinilytica TaxID=2683194 RepID=UPI00193C173A|nr:protease complex subunit PrcB family protein [Anaeromonas gelatinilytica]MBS4534094.1 protease complex subunit PrcB family protein [Anaeromonas gelatinilytica]